MNRDLGKLTKGQEVWIKIIKGSNIFRYIKDKSNIENFIYRGEIIKVGRKYITVKFGNFNEEKFNIEDDYRNYYTCGGADYKLYLSKQEIIEEIQSENLYSEIRSYFSEYGGNKNKFSLDQLRRIANIINESEEMSND